MTKRLQFLNSNSTLHIFLFGLLSIIILSALQFFNMAKLGYQIRSSEKDVICFLILFSYPHFIASYYWFYKNKTLREENKTVGWYLPLGIVAVLIGVFSMPSKMLLQPMLIVAWILLFWHFVKQSYGCSVYLAQQNFPTQSKSWLLFSYLCLAGFGFLNIQRHEAKVLVFKSYLSVHKVPEYFSLMLLVFAWALFLAFAVTYLKQNESSSLKDKVKKMCIISVPWIANLMWFSWWSVESFFVLIPIFHAIQYGPFILQGVARLQTEVAGFYKVMAGILIISAALFVGVPFVLNRTIPEAAPAFVTSVFIFLNLHHFFIDSVGWKLSRESLRKILFS